jgi:single-stranded DNA-specific DHH superfamily exonuclease
MLTDKQIKEFRKYLHKSKNPLFFFDDDPDGLCSYLILKKYVQRGKGAVLRVASILDLSLYHKVKEYNPDYIFVLDIPIIDQDFIDQVNVPIIWLDHHTPIERKGVKYFNPVLTNSNEPRPTTYMAYKIAEEKELFLGTLGCISDWYYPEFAKEFSKKYPDLLSSRIKNPPKAIFDSKLGELINIFAFSLKNPTSKVHKIANTLIKIESPYELLENETSRSKFVHKEIKTHVKEFENLMKTLSKVKPTREKLLIVDLPVTKNSYTSIVSNYFLYKYPQKVTIVARKRDYNVLMSIRSKEIDINKILEKSLKDLDGFGGGHKTACGASVRRDQFEDFIKKFKEYLKK